MREHSFELLIPIIKLKDPDNIIRVCEFNVKIPIEPVANMILYLNGWEDDVVIKLKVEEVIAHIDSKQGVKMVWTEAITALKFSEINYCFNKNIIQEKFDFQLKHLSLGLIKKISVQESFFNFFLGPGVMLVLARKINEYHSHNLAIIKQIECNFSTKDIIINVNHEKGTEKEEINNIRKDYLEDGWKEIKKEDVDK